MSCSLLAFRRKIRCPTALAAFCTSSMSVSALGLVGFTSMAMSRAFGTISRSSANFFASNSDVNRLAPVTLPPGRLRLATKPTLTGKSLPVKTIGIIDVAALAASAGRSPPAAMITATCRFTRSVAMPGNRSNCPSAQRNSIAIFWPSR